MKADWLLGSTTGFVVVATGLGCAASRRRLEHRWLHHAAYLGTLASASCATVAYGAGLGRPAVPLGVLVGVLAMLPTTRAGSRRHVTVALAAVATTAAAVAVAVTSR